MFFIYLLQLYISKVTIVAFANFFDEFYIFAVIKESLGTSCKHLILYKNTPC